MIFLALGGHHILVALTWGIALAIVFVLLYGLAPVEAILYFDAEAGVGVNRVAEHGHVVGEGLEELGADLVGALADRGADHGGDAPAVRAEALHRAERGFEHPVERALPARMRRADDAGLAVTPVAPGNR